MTNFFEPILESVDSFLEWFTNSLKQTAGSYCDLEAVDNEHTLVARDGSLLSVIKIDGAQFLVGSEEFSRLHTGVAHALQTALSRPGHGAQILFAYDNENVEGQIKEVLAPAIATAKRLQLELDDLFNERVQTLGRYCAEEKTFIVLWTFPTSMSNQQQKAAFKNKLALIKKQKIPPMRYAQSVIATTPELREVHESFTRATLTELETLGLAIKLLDVHTVIREARFTIDQDFTDKQWSPYLPGDRIPVRELKLHKRDISEVLWPSLSSQILPRDGENLNLRICRIGDRIYAPLFIELFPKEVKSFTYLFNRVVAAKIPWRVSFMVESNGLASLGFKAILASILSFASTSNPMISDARNLLQYFETNTDDAVVRLKVSLTTWAKVGEEALLKSRAAELAKAVQGWGYCEVSEVSGDPFGAVVSSSLALSSGSLATPSVAPLSEVVYMLPIARPSSPWQHGALLLRSPDGKLWPYQPGSSMQTTWIDLIYARPGSGKSVLSNAINLALCLNAGQERLPRIAIIDVGPSSSGLISLLKEALPTNKKHLVAYHRLRMTAEYAINPFDTQLGARFPTPLERSFLVNFLTLLATPLSAERAYDGISDMVGMVVDEVYKLASDQQNPHRYASNVDKKVDELLYTLELKVDEHTSWWEITDALFDAGYKHEALLAQRFAVPLLADVAAVCRTPAVEDLFGKIIAPTGETLIQSFSRMVSSAIREYPILSRTTAFDLGESRVVSLDLDEVAKTGGEAADRQTAVMYMIARYILGRDYYLINENVQDMPKRYRDYHRGRVLEIREDQKRIVFDEFHRTAKAKSVRDQVLVDMREGRKWKVQIALLSQALEDFDEVMVDFATSVFIMDAGPAQSLEKSAKTFGLSDTAKNALRTRVHGPRAGGGTFLAQFATKEGMNTQLLTNTLGPIELWAFSTTAEDAYVRNALYDRIGPSAARKILAKLYPSGSVAQVVERRLLEMRDAGELSDESSHNVLQNIIEEILKHYQANV
ncbi:MAG: type IV secretion protein IcmB [Legionellales bacterium]|jgi:intracellular multiplication protein IcmB